MTPCSFVAIACGFECRCLRLSRWLSPRVSPPTFSLPTYRSGRSYCGFRGDERERRFENLSRKSLSHRAVFPSNPLDLRVLTVIQMVVTTLVTAPCWKQLRGLVG
jgi:hypothetical protein